MKVILVFFAILGASFASPISQRDLADDLQDFIDLIPVDKIDAILKDHLATDGAFVAVVNYLQGPEWAELVDNVHSNPAVQEFEQYLTDAGIPVADIINAIHDLIGNAVPGTAPDDAGSLKGFLDDIVAVLPVEELIALLFDKLQTSSDFQELYKKISSPEAKALVDEIRKIPEVQRLAQRLKELGVPVDEILAVVFAFLGWDYPKVAVINPRDLADDLQDFLDLIPVDKIDAILKDHLATDGAFVAVVNYLQGPEWAELVDNVHSNPAVQEFEQYLTDAGIPVADIINAIHDLIANAVPGTAPDAAGSLKGFLEDIVAVLPVEELIALLFDKLQTSSDFQELYKKISSPEAKALVDEIRKIPEVQRLAQRLKELGVPVDEILAVVFAFLGWDYPKVAVINPRDLADDLQDFLDLIPVDKIDAILKDHLATDGAFVAVVNYLQGPEWTELLDTVHSNPAVQEFEQYLTDAGIPVADIINAIHDLIANAVPGTAPDDAGSLKGFLEDIVAVLPVEELIALLWDKLQTSADFQELYKKISSPEAKALVDEIRKIPEVQRLAQRLRELDVPVDEILAVAFAFLGWDYPKFI